MAYRREKNGDIVISGFEKGIAASPHLGIANLKNVNLATETGEVMCSFDRTKESQTNITAGTVTYASSTTLTVSGTTPANTTLKYGQWITVGTGITGLSSGTYFVASSSGNTITLKANYSSSSTMSGYSSGSATFTLLQNTSSSGAVMTQLIGSATEQYTDSSFITQYRYYILDTEGHVWVKDTGVNATGSSTSWALIDTVTARSSASLGTTGNATGIGVINGYLFVLIGNSILSKETCMLGYQTETAGTAGWDNVTTLTSNKLQTPIASANPHFTFLSQSTLYYCDGNLIGSIFPSVNSSATTGNIWSYGSYTVSVANPGVFTVTALYGGAKPYNGMPVTFTTDNTFPTASGGGISKDTIYYVVNASNSGATMTFEIAKTSGGSAVQITNAGTGNQYFNTFNPIVYNSSPASSTYVFTGAALTLPSNDIAQSIVDSGTNLIVGTQGNHIYQWDRVSPQAQSTVPLSEENISFLLNVNNMTYAFVGNKGNIYITNGSTASVALTVPDYCAGTAGTPASYIEPYFIWGGAMYLRGRIYFSIQDQTASKTGQCGGIWSFIPTNNMYIGQDTGLAMRIENENSYATYNGMATVLLANQNQQAISPQFFSGWQSTYSGTSYGVDNTSTIPGNQSIIETDLIPTGTLLDKDTFSQIEYKLSSPLNASDSVALYYRLNLTDAFSAFTNLNTETSTDIAGYYSMDFEKSQWLQIRAVLTPVASSSSSFCRLTEIRIR